VFRDELCNLLPNVEAARRLQAQTFTLAEFLTEVAEQLPVMTLHRRALVHGHCHHKAILGMQAERSLLDCLGLQYNMLDSGCCGMAGSFGFEREHYDISQALGERVLLPAVREAPRDVLILADGFSCREQIAQSTNRRALHLAEVLQMAMEHGPHGPPGDLPERHYVHDHADATLRPREVLTGAALVAGGLALVARGIARARR
jgi:Fe-S oxidoreductase